MEERDGYMQDSLMSSATAQCLIGPSGKSLRKLALSLPSVLFSLFLSLHYYVITKLQEQSRPDLHQHFAPEGRDNEATVRYDSARKSGDVFINSLPGEESAV
jgi:hypothetical protein